MPFPSAREESSGPAWNSPYRWLVALRLLRARWINLISILGVAVGVTSIIVVLAVMVPCCLSDIIFPMLMTKTGRAKYAKEPHACH